jgi:hypothetical protein
MAAKPGHPRHKLVNRLAHEIGQKLARHQILLADGLLDEARRFLLTKIFSGASDELIIKQLGTPPESLGIAGRLLGLSVVEVLGVDSLVRTSLWCAHFATMAGTRCAQQFDAYMAEVRARESNVVPLDPKRPVH